MLSAIGKLMQLVLKVLNLVNPASNSESIQLSNSILKKLLSNSLYPTAQKGLVLANDVIIDNYSQRKPKSYKVVERGYLPVREPKCFVVDGRVV